MNFADPQKSPLIFSSSPSQLYYHLTFYSKFDTVITDN